jgi:hypothetical protein
VAWPLLAAVASLGCDELLEVRLPTQVPADALNDPALAPVLVRSAIADFECAFANYVVQTGQLTDELQSSTRSAGPAIWDLRRVTSVGTWSTLGCTKDAIFQVGVYTPLSTARWYADFAYTRIDAFPAEDIFPAEEDVNEAARRKEALLAAAAAYAGYSYTLFGEGFCAAAFDGGPSVAPLEILGLAEQRFTTAISLAQGSDTDSTLNMALVGRARVRLDLGKTVEAAEDAGLVDSGFVKHATYSAANERRMNRIYDYNQRIQVVSVDPRFRDLEVDGVPDPRVAVFDAGRPGNDGLTPLWLQTKYLSESSPIELASWNEAQLIIAEAEGGQTAVDRINALRRQTGLPLFASGDPTEIAQQVIEERRRELFLEGHRLNDMLRLGLPLDTGPDHLGRPRGSTTCIPLPRVECDNNPNATC